PSARAIEFRAMFQAESSFVWNSLRRLGVHPNDQEDLMHEVFLTAYRRLDDYDRSRPVRPWLFGIAYHITARHRDRAHHRREVRGVAVEVAGPGPSAEDQLIAHEARQLLGRALDELDLDRRAVFLLHDVEGCSMSEIAAVLGVPLNTAYSRLRLGRAQ